MPSDIHSDIQDTRPQLIGASVFSTNDVYVRLKQFKARLPRDNMGNLCDFQVNFRDQKKLILFKAETLLCQM
jgi:hypothetical protein